MIDDLLLLVPPIVGIYLLWRNDIRGRRVISLFLSSAGMAALLKLIFRIERDVGIDPFAFPSIHTAAAASLFFSLPHPLTLLYTVIMGTLRVMGGYHSVLDVVGGFLVAGLVSLIPSLVKDKDIDRKLVHFGLSMLVGFFMLFVDQIILGTALVVGLMASYFIKPLWNAFSRVEKDRAPFYLSLGIFAGSLMGVGPVIAITMALVDFLSYLVGKLFGTTEKSNIGLLGGFLGGITTLLLLRGFYPLLYLLPIAILSPLIERYSHIDDNASIPFFIVLTTLFVELLL